METELIYKEECYKIIGCAMEVHQELGNGFLEAVYQETLSMEFKSRKIPFSQQEFIEIYYKEQLLDKKYIADFVCYDKIIIEMKTVEKLKSEHYSQVLNYLKATNFKLGLLINFGSRSLEYKRIVR